MKILGIDYGDKKIGLAISDDSEKLASRFMTLENKPLKNIIREIKSIISDQKIKEVVIGIPVGLKVWSGQTKKTDNFADKLSKEIGIPVKKVNEVYTSKMAEKNLLDGRVKREEIKRIIDQEAARIILQDYLESKKSI